MATTDIKAGDIIAARPWLKGEEGARRQALVVNATYGNDGEYLLVWFSSLGELCDAETGRAFQPILRTKAELVGHVGDARTAAELEDLGGYVNRSNLREVYPLYQAILAAIKAKQA